MKFTQMLLAAAFSLTAVAAQAVTVTGIQTSTQGAGNTAHLYAGTFAANTPSGASWSGAAPVVTPPPGNASGIYQSPFNNTPLLDTQSYFSVGATDGVNGALSPMTLDLGTAVRSMDFLWGSIDSYNTISFYGAANNLLDSFTGSDIVTLLNLGGVAANFEQVALMTFGAEQEGFRYITFASSQAAFEFALPATSEVPVPASGLLLMLGLGGVAAARRRKA